MTTAEALGLISVLASYFRTELSDETGIVWSRSLVQWELRDGLEAAAILGEGLRFMPSLREFEDAIRDIRSHRLVSETPALPEPGGPYCGPVQFLRETDPETRERGKRAWAGLAAKYAVDIEAEAGEKETLV